MTENPHNMRELMEILEEGSLKDLAKSAANKVNAALGDKKAQGAEEAKRLAKYFKKQFEIWLGKSGNEPNEKALFTYLVSKVGYTPANARKIFAKSGIQDPTKTESIVEDLKRADLDKVFLNAAYFAYEHDLVNTTDDDDKADDKKVKSQTKSNNVSRSKQSQTQSDPYAELRGKTNNADDSKEAVKKFNTSIMQNAGRAGIDEYNMRELMQAIEEVKGNYADIRSRKDYEDIQEMLARVGFAYLRSQQS